MKCTKKLTISKTKHLKIIFSLLSLSVSAYGSSNIKPTKVSTSTPVKVTSNFSTNKTCQNPIYESLGIEWSHQTTVYKGVMKLSGCSGKFTVSFWDNEIKKTAKVEQHIRIADSAFGIMLYGHNPVYPQTSINYSNYAADNFLFHKQVDGTNIILICDDIGQCSPAQLFNL